MFFYKFYMFKPRGSLCIYFFTKHFSQRQKIMLSKLVYLFGHCMTDSTTRIWMFAHLNTIILAPLLVHDYTNNKKINISISPYSFSQKQGKPPMHAKFFRSATLKDISQLV